MTVIIVIDPTGQQFKPLVQILAKIDAQLKPVWVPSFKHMTDWFKENIVDKQEEILQQRQLQAQAATQEGAPPSAASAKPPASEQEDANWVVVPLIVINSQVLRAEHFPLLEKIQLFLKSKKASPTDRTTKILLTAHEGEDIQIEQYVLPIIQNILYAPFDEAITRNRLKWAIEGSEALKSEGLNSIEAFTPVEIVKRVEVERVSELGFRTINDSDLSGGKVAKYYGQLFSDLPGSGAFAISTRSEPHPKLPKKFSTSFAFWGISNELIKSVRKKVRAHKGCLNLLFVPPKPKDVEQFSMVVIHREQVIFDRIKDQLEREFSNLKVFFCQSLTEFTLAVDPALMSVSGDSGLWPIDGQEIKVIYDDGGEIYLNETSPDLKDDEVFLGLRKNQLDQLRQKIILNCNDTQRAQVLLNFRSDSAKHKPVTFAMRHKGEVEFVTLVGSESFAGEDGKGHMKQKRRVILRKASEDEIAGLSKVDAQMNVPDHLIGVFVDEYFTLKKDAEFWANFRQKLLAKENAAKTLKSIHLYSVGESAVTEYSKRDRLEGFADHFVEPIDSYYFARAINHAHLKLVGRDQPLGRDYFEEPLIFKAATPVKVLRLSEVSVTIRYHRVVKETEFRRFLLWDSEGNVLPELIAKCVASEVDPENSSQFQVQFVFFGLIDSQLQYVRKWLLDQYNESKKEPTQKKS